jgi:hypothetical protein
LPASQNWGYARAIWGGIAVGGGKAEVAMADELATGLHATYQQIAAERQKRILQHQENIAEIKARGGRELNILADGDSWFDYPLSRDVIDWLRADGTPSPEILDLAVAGDPVTSTLGVTKRERIIANLTNPANGTFDALLFSGGGDDIAGDQFCFWLTDNVAGSNGINAASLGDILGVVQTGYHDLFTICGKHLPNCKVFVHGYDYARATGIGACPLLTGGYAAGPWLKPSLDFRSWTNFNDAAVIIKTILQQFDQLLLQLENQYKPQVIYVRTQGTLTPPSSINDRNSDWANELHPTDGGFGKIAGQFLTALRNVFPGRI